jgi:hypothetical protein
VVECISYITESYQQISLAFKDLLQVGQDQQPVGGTQFNWPSFATWASNSVGMNIRNETLQIIVKELLPSFPDWLQKLIDKLGPDWIIKLPVIRDLFAQVFRVILSFISSFYVEVFFECFDAIQMGRGLCGGNLHVFHEIGAKFSLFGASFVGQSAYNQSSLDAYLSTFVPGPASKGGQDQLKEAMRNYYIAMWMRNDSEQRAQHLALANALVGLQEQTELQPYIIEAFPAPFNITIAGKTVTIDIRPACTVMISLIMATETLIPTKDIPQRLDGKTWSTLVENVTLDQYASLYAAHLLHFQHYFLFIIFLLGCFCTVTSLWFTTRAVRISAH